MTETDIFISYSSEDRTKARTVATCLEREGFSVWWDASIHSGESFDLVIERELASAKAVIVLWSPRSVSSRWVRAEASSADRAGKLVPVTIETCNRPIIFELLHTIDLSHWNGDVADPAWQQLLLDLHRTVRLRREPSSAVPDSGPPPQQPVQPSLGQMNPGNSPSAFPALGSPGLGTDGADDDDVYEATQFSAFEPAPEIPGHFLYLVVDGKTEKQFPVGLPGVLIGRTPPADVILADKHVSRRHCRVEFEGDQLVVVDLGSTNGTFVDEEKVVDRAVLRVGSVLRIGPCELIHELRTSAFA